MENQDQRKIHAPENHGGVHLCHKCGWPFPNPHPSARHRRAHKRVCGKIEGHKLIDSEGSNHSALSDDEHVSDDDNKNPIIVESVKTEKGMDESKEQLKRSEEDVFSDAVADFSDSKLAGNTKDSSTISEMDKKEELTSLQSFKDCEISDLAQLSGTSTEKIILNDPEGVQSTVDQLVAGEDNTRSQEQSLNVPADIYIDLENMDSQSNVAVETIQPELKIEEIIERASDLIPTKEVVQLLEGHGACIDPETPQADMASEVAAKSCSSDYLVECSAGEDRNKNVHTVSVLDDLNISDHSEPENTVTIKGMEEGKDVVSKPLDEILVREPDASEIKFIDSDNPKQEQEIDRIPKSLFPVDCTRDFSELASVTEEAPGEGFNLIEIPKENPDTEIEEMKGLEEEDLPMVEELPETDRKDTDCVSESNIILISSNSHDGMMEPEISKLSLAPVNDESLIHCSATVEDNISAEVGGAVIISEPLQVEGNDIIDKPVVTGSSIDVTADCSQASSVDGIPGSELSGVSIRSNAPAVVDDHAAAGAEKSDRKMQKATSQNSERSDGFEPPSFPTLVEQDDEDSSNSNAADSENQNKKEPQAGWFPSFIPVPSDSDGRKKNEELISEVTSQKAGKQHTPLKNLLDEADLDAEPKFPKLENLPLPAQNDEKTAKSNIGTINSEKTTTNEWDSPARLQEEIKKEKKKGKGIPYWAQLVCCTSANY